MEDVKIVYMVDATLDRVLSWARKGYAYKVLREGDVTMLATSDLDMDDDTLDVMLEGFTELGVTQYTLSNGRKINIIREEL